MSQSNCVLAMLHDQFQDVFLKFHLFIISKGMSILCMLRIMLILSISHDISIIILGIVNSSRGQRS